MCELICDGVHVHPAAVRMLFRQMGAEDAQVRFRGRDAGVPGEFEELPDASGIHRIAHALVPPFENGQIVRGCGVAMQAKGGRRFPVVGKGIERGGQ